MPNAQSIAVMVGLGLKGQKFWPRSLYLGAKDLEHYLALLLHYEVL